MHQNPLAALRGAAAALALLPASALATDYYVAPDGNDTYAGTVTNLPFATIDKAVITATSGDDVIHVAPGTYLTGHPEYVAQTDNAKWGPNLKAKLIGEGLAPADVVLQSYGTYRTLRMAAGSWVENVTIVGEVTFQADKGGAIEISGGTLTNCVGRDGTAKANGNTAGGNVYVNHADAIIANCEIYGGSATNRGGNVYLDRGLIYNCTIHDGTCANNIGGNVYQYQGTISNCVIYGGTAKNDGGNVRMNGSGLMVDCVISNGTVQANDKKGANVYMDSTAKMSRCRLVGGADTYDNNGGSLALGSSTAVAEDCLVEGSHCGGVLMTGTSYLYNSTVVNNENFGCWAWNNNQHFFNVVIYGNASEWNGNLPNNASAEFLGCASSSGARIVTDGNFGVTPVSDSAFVDFAGGDYRPAAGSPLIDAGVADPRGAAASTTDLDGNLRASGAIDIGCYEYQKPDMVVHVDGAAYSRVFAPASVTFTHSTDNSASPENVVFTYDFGDGGTNETTSAATISHEYAAPGVYTVAISATNAVSGEFAEMTYDGYVRVASSVVHVTPGNGAGTFPYDTPETGYGNLKTAVQAALDGYTLLLGEGVHETVDQISFSKAIAIRGVGATPEAVVVRNTTATPNTYYHRTMEMNNPTGRIENLTIENGRVKNSYGANLRLVAGVVSNCVIRGGLAVADGGLAAGGGVELAGSGILTHCVVTNNTVSGTSSQDAYAGGAVFLPYGAKTAKLLNTLVAYNRYVPSDNEKRGAAGIRFGGGNEQVVVENCTVVSNVVEGSITSGSAGAFCNSWSTTVRNTVFAGNYVTGLGACSSVNFESHMNVVNCAMDDAAWNQYCVSGPVSAMFRNFAAGDFRPLSGGILYNKGATPSVAASVDLAGADRVMFGRIDVGCYECPFEPATMLIIR